MFELKLRMIMAVPKEDPVLPIIKMRNFNLCLCLYCTMESDPGTVSYNWHNVKRKSNIVGNCSKIHAYLSDFIRETRNNFSKTEYRKGKLFVQKYTHIYQISYEKPETILVKPNT
jgi:hypothetical protein